MATSLFLWQIRPSKEPSYKVEATRNERKEGKASLGTGIPPYSITNLKTNRIITSNTVIQMFRNLFIEKKKERKKESSWNVVLEVHYI